MKTKKLAKDPYAGKKIRCGICKRLIRKGERYWMMGPWITCKDCHSFIHGDEED